MSSYLITKTSSIGAVNPVTVTQQLPQLPQHYPLLFYQHHACTPHRIETTKPKYKSKRKNMQSPTLGAPGTPRCSRKKKEKKNMPTPDADARRENKDFDTSIAIAIAGDSHPHQQFHGGW
ncbi:hypothetical protein HYFRA_00009150 [Hymenoscyphus fraxineus]|uniref:Uncharacterized protein n=1 Tax=Hymenoscyphus fraxineus TaxID=746836 RepID=A0A9N9PI73_9HELO|nr:hypothetical protein HYFRA_00009150 [Hymenoscyphus fraxineus]